MPTEDPRVIIRASESEIAAWHRRTANEFPRSWKTKDVATLLMREWFAGRIAIAEDGVVSVSSPNPTKEGIASRTVQDYTASSTSDPVLRRMAQLMESNPMAARAVVAFLSLVESIFLTAKEPPHADHEDTPDLQGPSDLSPGAVDRLAREADRTAEIGGGTSAPSEVPKKDPGHGGSGGQNRSRA